MTNLRQIKGRGGEAAVLSDIRKKGYQIELQNFRWRGGEVDIIAWDKKILCFIEVKHYGPHQIDPLLVITPKKRRHLRTTALVFLAQNQLKDVQIRFDLAVVKSMTHIEYYENIDVYS